MGRYHGGFTVCGIDGQEVGQLDVKVDGHGDIDLWVQLFTDCGHVQLVLGLDPSEAFELSGALKQAGEASRDLDERTIPLGEELRRTVDTNG